MEVNNEEKMVDDGSMADILQETVVSHRMYILIFWQLITLTSLLMAVHAGKQYWIQKEMLHVFPFNVFLTLSVGFGFIGYMYGMDFPKTLLEPLWTLMTVITVLLLTPVFYAYFDRLASDFGGFCMEAGVILMLVGLMLVITGDFHVIPWIGMISLTLFYMGYIRLRALVKQH
jgi:hypothetical protein